VQQSLQPKLSHRRYADVSYVLQNNTVFRRAQNWVSVRDGTTNRQWEWIPECWTRNSKTCLAVSRSPGAWNCKVTPSSWTEVTNIFNFTKQVMLVLHLLACLSVSGISEWGQIL